MPASPRKLVGGSVFGRARLGPRATAASPPGPGPARTARKHCHQPILVPPPLPPLHSSNSQPASPVPQTSTRLNVQTSKRLNVQTSKRRLYETSRIGRASKPGGHKTIQEVRAGGYTKPAATSRIGRASKPGGHRTIQGVGRRTGRGGREEDGRSRRRRREEEGRRKEGRKERRGAEG